jgi:hypothetical protein
MPKSYRLKTKIGVDQSIRVNIEQDFDFLEVLSLKLRQEDVYTRFCADYGVVVGRVVANGGYGIPNANVSVFVPVDEIDLEDPVISTLYPYQSPEEKNEDGFRYNLLPYVQEYGGHTPTGTFPTRQDVISRQEVLEIYEKYYKFTVKTNDSGDFMIVGVPLGIQKVVLDLDLSNMGCFSLRPQDLIRMGRGTQDQFNGSQFKSSSDLASLPQIVNQVKDVDVASFWGQEDLCNIGITRVDFDLRDLNIEIEPTAVFMGSIFSSADNQMLKKNCKPKTEQGDLCGLVTGPGEILSIRQTIDIDNQGDPILEQYLLPNAGKVIDGDGTFVTEVPMNLDYVYTNEFGEEVISNDPSIGVPTKGKYRFKVKYQSEQNGPPVVDSIFNPIKGEIIRGNFLVPQIREYGWTGSAINPGADPATLNNTTTVSLNFNNPNQVETQLVSIPNNASVEVGTSPDAENIEVYVNGRLSLEKWIDFPNGGTLEIRVTKRNNLGVFSPVVLDYTLYDYRYSQYQKSYAFSLDWNEYADKTAGINCDDFFYEMVYNKVYTTAQMIEEFRNGSGRARFVGIKEVLDRGCESTTNKFPTNDGVRNFDFLYFLFNILISLLTPIIVILIPITHLLALVWPVLKWVLTIFLIGYLTYQTVYYGIATAAAFPAVGLMVLNGVVAIALGVITAIFVAKVAPLIIKFNFKSFGLPMMSYPDCLACECAEDDMSSDEITDGFPGGSEPGEGQPVRKYTVWDNGGTSVIAPLNNPSTWSILGGDPTNNEPEGIDPDNYSGNGSKQNAKYTADLWGVRYGLAGYTEPNSPYYGAPIVRRYSNGNQQNDSKYYLIKDVTTTQSLNMMNVKSRYFNNTYNQTNGQNIIKTTVGNNPSFTDSVLIMLLGGTGSLNQGQIISFNDVNQIQDLNYSASTNPVNQFGSQSITGTTSLSTSKTVSYLDENGNTQNVTLQLTANGTEKEYLFKTGVEYFQVIDSMSLSDVKSMVNNNSGLLWNHLVRNITVPYFDPSGAGSTTFTVDPLGVIDTLSDNYKLVILNRGVDVWSDKQNIEYDLSKLFGYSSFNSSVSVVGQFYLNIPIQNNTVGQSPYVPEEHDVSYSTSSLYHEPFNFTVDPSTYTAVQSPMIRYYSSLGKDSNFRAASGTKPIIDYVTVTNGVYLDNGINEIKFNGTVQGVVNGGTFIGSTRTQSITNPDNSIADLKATVFSPRYSNINVNISGSNPKLIIRSDRLPTSDIEKTNQNNSMAFHMNPNFAIYYVDSDSTTSISQNAFDSNDIAQDFEDEYSNSGVTSVINSFSCNEMVPLSCYEYDPQNNTIVVNPNCSQNTDPELVVNGCYRLLEKPYVVGINRDLSNFAEWKSRFRFMFGVCRNVMSLTFVNNWVNGSLYMYSFQKDDLYGNDPNETKFLTTPDYEYCTDTIVFQEINNSFFYRASPYDGSVFTGKLPPVDSDGYLYEGSNKLLLGSPTTMMDMGPRDEFLQGICFNPDYKGYIIDGISSTSYKDTSDLLQVFIVSRLINTNFLQQLVGFGNASINSLFSRDNQRLDGDLTQMLSINSEFGVAPYLGNNYNGDALYYDAGSNQPHIGIFFSANTIDRDYITPGRETFRDNAVSAPLFNQYGFRDQEVPYHPWKIQQSNNLIFGNDNNDWLYKQTSPSSVETIEYQSIDRLNSSKTFPSNVTTPTTEIPGFIYNSKNNAGTVEYDPQNINFGSRKLLVGAPYHFYFGLKVGNSAMNRYIDKYLFNQEIL